jgi:hypothetical protein
MILFILDRSLHKVTIEMGSQMKTPQKGVITQLLEMESSSSTPASKSYETGSLKLLLSTDTNYRTCLNCQSHPSYPEIPPSTLHRGQQCLICGIRQ